MDRESFQNGLSNMEAGNENNSEQKYEAKSVRKKKDLKNTARPYSPEKPSSFDGKYKDKKKKSFSGVADSESTASTSPRFSKIPKKKSSKEENHYVSDFVSKMNSTDNMRKNTKPNRRASVPNDPPELKYHNNDSANYSPSSSKAGFKPNKDPKFRSKTPDSKAASIYSGKKGYPSAKKSIKFEPYIPLFQVQQGLKRGEFIEGALRINPRNYEDAYINSPDGKMDIYIGGMQNRNRALNGDIVVVQINPKQEWRVLCDAIKDYQEKCGKTIVDTVCEPIPPASPCKVHTPDPFVRPRPFSSNSWDSACRHRSPDTLEILGFDKLAQQFENMSVKQKSKSKCKKKCKSSKQEKECGSQKSSTASYSHDSSEDCLDKLSPGQSSDRDNKGSLVNMEEPKLQTNVLAEESISSIQDTLYEQPYPPYYMKDIGEFHVNTETNHKDSKWLSNEDSVNLIISPEELLHIDGHSILNYSSFHKMEVINDNSSSDVEGIVVPPGDLSGDEFTDSASIGSSYSENLDKVIEDSSFLASQQDAENNNVDLIPQSVDSVVHFTGYNNSVVSIQMPLVSTEASVETQCKMQYNKSVSPVAAINANPESVCVSEILCKDHVNNVQEDIVLEHFPVTEFQVPAVINDSIYQSNENIDTKGKKQKHRKRRKKSNANKRKEKATNILELLNEGIEDKRNETITFNNVHDLTVDEVMQHPEWERFIQRTGKVVHILERKHSCLAAGHLKLLPDKNVKWALFSPSDSRIPRILIPMSDCPPNFYYRPFDFSNVLFLAEIKQWEEHCTYASGNLIKQLGHTHEVDVQTEGILIENAVDTQDFDEEVLSCLPQEENWVVPEEEIKNRRDFRNQCVFTIDPATARDMDDAVSCELLSNGNYEIGVHIADVTYFVPEDSKLDKIAKERSTSVYLVQKVIPMLPRKLCDDLCSLNPGKDRLTFSVVWEMSSEGEIFRQWIGRSVINSCVKLSYQHAQDMIENPSREWSESEHPTMHGRFTIKDVIQRVNELHQLAVKLRDKRFLNGALRLDQVKLEFTLSPDSGLPLGFNIYIQKDSNKLIEEFMLLANMSVARKIYETFPELALLRRHPPPQPKPMQDTVAMCESMGIVLDATTSGTLQNSIAYYRGHDFQSHAMVQVLMNLCSKPMNCALYFCTGAVEDTTLYSHYALNVPLYTHFTSPIRRYPDVIVHRLLSAALNYNPIPNMTAVTMQKCATLCNDKKYNAKRVSELSAELFLAAFIRNLGSVYTKAMVTGVMDHSFDCLILDMGIIKRVYCDKLPLLKKEYKRSHGVSVLNLTWKDDFIKEGVKQTIVLFTLVNVVMTVAKESLIIKVSLLKPES